MYPLLERPCLVLPGEKLTLFSEVLRDQPAFPRGIFHFRGLKTGTREWRTRQEESSLSTVLRRSVYFPPYPADLEGGGSFHGESC